MAFAPTPLVTAVTGASGHLGAALCRQLLAEGHRVRVLRYRDAQALEGLDVVQIPGSLHDPDSLLRLMQGAEVVFHLAAAISIGEVPAATVFRTNQEGTQSVINCCQKAGVRRLVYVSSVHAHRVPPKAVVFDETAPLAVDHGFPYERSKAAAQQLVAEAGMKGGIETIILNPTSVIGPWDFKPSRQGRMLIDLYRGRVPALPPGGFDWVDSRDVAASAAQAAFRGTTGDSYLIPGRFAPVRELCALAGAVTGKAMPGRTAPFWLLDLAVPVLEGMASIAGKAPVLTREALAHLKSGHPGISGQKAGTTLGHTPRPLEETLRDTYAWFAKHGKL